MLKTMPVVKAGRVVAEVVVEAVRRTSFPHAMPLMAVNRVSGMRHDASDGGKMSRMATE